MPAPRPLRSTDPRQVGDFTLVGWLGEGGQGTVFLGSGPDGEQVAVKLLRADLSQDSRARRYFERELDTDVGKQAIGPGARSHHQSLGSILLVGRHHLHLTVDLAD